MSKYAYEKLIEEEKLDISEIPEDAKIGISAIKHIEKAILMCEKKGRKPTAKVLAKIKANDKWVTRELLDYMEGKDSGQSDEIPHTPEEIKADIDEAAKADEVQVDARGVAIDAELKALLESGVSSMTVEELKAKAPKAYSVVFENYEKDGENGIETSFHKLIETEKEKFTLQTI